ncbi:MAG: mechanosensitive ion channel [Verrucomicrobiota bacterium JB023]|nr:mechanosensitive ion channel [Verrucomicrobiota bacterium JB023]
MRLAQATPLNSEETTTLEVTKIDLPTPPEETIGEQNFLHYVLDKLRQAFVELADEAINKIPDLVVAIVLLMIGFIFAKVIRSVLATVFKRINLDGLLEKVGLTEIFAKMGIKSGPSSFIPKLVYWLIVFLSIRMAADSAGIEDISNVIDQIMAFLPKVLTAAIITLVGFIVADIVRNAVQQSLESLGIEYGSTVAKILFSFLFIIVLTVALSQLGIETELLNSSVKIILSGLAAALALALGLGLKTLAGHIVAGVYARDLYDIGTELHYDGDPAKVAGIGPVTTKLTRNDGSFIIIPNSVLVNEIIRGRREN